jgi:serine phosphatase RsbU (regulator of sigma subunit)
MIDLALAESPFITMVYAMYNRREGTVSFARAGHPYPLYVPQSGEPELWRVHGTLLGVFDTEFTTLKIRMNHGDKLLLYTDGIETTLGGEDREGVQRLLAAAGRHRDLPVQEWVVRLSREVFGEAGQVDDLTLLGLEVAEDPVTPLVPHPFVPVK